MVPFDGDPRLALVTVNFSTTRYLKLMLCTLGEQSALWLLERIVVVDNGSRDGGRPFLRALADRVPRIHLVERRLWLNHAAGMRAGVRALHPIAPSPNMLVFCDPDVVFRNPDTLLRLAAAMADHDAAFAGEARAPTWTSHPDVQASLFAVRTDVVARRDIRPLANHGSPAYALQASLLAAGLTIVDFPSNHGGYVLHRGRTGVAAAGTHHRWHSYAGVAMNQPHYMGVAAGPAIWAEVEQRWAPLLDPGDEPALLDHLAARFASLGADPAT